MASEQNKGPTEASPLSTNLRLKHLAVHKILDAMQQSVKRMDQFISIEMSKLDANGSRQTLVSTAGTMPGTRGSISSGLEADVESLSSSRQPTPLKTTKTLKSTTATATPNRTNVNASTSYSFPQCPVDPHVLRKAAKDMFEARNYILKSLQNELHPFLMKHVIVRAINDRNVQMVRLAIQSTVQVLDFRALDWSIGCADVPQHLLVAPIRSSSSLTLISSEISMSDLTPSSTASPPWTASIDDVHSFASSCSTKSFNFPSNFFTPPNEFDWFSRDKMGKILSLWEACELFSIIKMADCAKHLKQLCMNAKRANYIKASSDEALMAVTETLTELKYLTKLVLRGMCDDEILKIIGQNMIHLEHLDVSGSQFVTDTGIQHLFFKERNKNSVLYLISAWIVKNMDKMNPCTHTLIYLDYSWTGVSSMGRKMVQLLPGSYLFKRLMYSAGREHYSFGHHIFIREAPCMHDQIPTKVESSQCKIFEKHLIEHVGLRGVKCFLKMIEHHPWRNCILNLYMLKNTDVLTNMTSYFGNLPNQNQAVKNKHCFGVITPNQSEKRIQGVVSWCDGILTQVYSIYPININTLGMLSHLRLFRGVVSELWRMQCSLLPDLVHLDIFAEPATLINIIQSCPSLRRLRVRIRRGIIDDDQLIKAVESSMCRRTIEDIWIAPGMLAEDESARNNNNDADKSMNRVESSSTKGNLSNASSLNSFSQKSSSKDKIPFSLSQAEALKLVELSIDCVEALIKACPKLKRLGDLSTWTEVDAEELYVYCEQLKSKHSSILIIWANMNLPNYSKKLTKTQK